MCFGYLNTKPNRVWLAHFDVIIQIHFNGCFVSPSQQLLATLRRRIRATGRRQEKTIWGEKAADFCKATIVDESKQFFV